MSRASVVAVLFVLACAGSPDQAVSSPAVLLPNLVPETPQRVKLGAERLAGDPLDHLLLRFDSVIHNVGPGVLEVRGSDPTDINGTVQMTNVAQVAYDTAEPAAQPRAVGTGHPLVLYYETVEGHAHFHLADAVTYSLVDDSEPNSGVPFAKHRAGFCLQDTEHVEGPLGPAFFTSELTRFCQEGTPAAPEVRMGILPGWQDRYVREIPFQWIDVTNARPGPYRLAETVDPQNGIAETNELDNVAAADGSASVTLPGYVARDGYARTYTGVPAPIELAAQRFESSVSGAQPVGVPEFAVVDPPAHGTLAPSAGWSSVATVVYTPYPGFEGPDSFTFAARDQDHREFPRNPSTATVAVRVVALNP